MFSPLNQELLELEAQTNFGLVVKIAESFFEDIKLDREAHGLVGASLSRVTLDLREVLATVTMSDDAISAIRSVQPSEASEPSLVLHTPFLDSLSESFKLKYVFAGDISDSFPANDEVLTHFKGEYLKLPDHRQIMSKDVRVQLSRIDRRGNTLYVAVFYNPTWVDSFQGDPKGAPLNQPPVIMIGASAKKRNRVKVYNDLKREVLILMSNASV